MQPKTVDTYTQYPPRTRCSRWIALVLMLCISLAVSGVSAQDGPTFELTVMHTNDTRANHLPPSDGNGGAARQATIVKQIRAEVENSILVDAGGRFTGTLFHRKFKGTDNVQVMNLMGYQAMTLGNPEFDDGDDVLRNFIEGLNFPVVSSNIDARNSVLADLIKPYVLLEVGESKEQLGIIGLTPAETPRLSSPSKDIIFSGGYAAAVQRQVELLKGQGINKIILLSQLGYTDDQTLAAQISGVDIIVGGNSRIVLSNLYTSAVGPYPTVVQSAAGEPVLIVQSGGGELRYMGRLDVTFDANGVITDWSGDNILMSRYIPPDPEMQALIDGLTAEVQALREETIQTLAGADAVANAEIAFVDCRITECPIGNLVADALRAESGAQIAIMNGGGIRAAIDAGNITVGEVFTVLPFDNLLATFTLRGSDVLAALENGLSRLGAESGTGRFAQVSGLRYVYTPNAPIGKRVLSVEVLNADGTFTPLDPDALYTVASNDFLRGGGDGYEMFATSAIDAYDAGRPIAEVLIDYIALKSPIEPIMDGRIKPDPSVEIKP
ncbi:MAG: bifunctional UDP-sugar hydrolase/5'-nucleotidase [Anaerolineae bacterium]